MRYNSTKTDRSDNFERRLKQTMDSELDPEQITPNTAGSEELPYDENFTLIDQFKQTNMHPGGPRPRSTQKQQGRSND
jgi:hypothetical protein